ncbi:MAG: helix-turn-helix domain-containing protein [Candidatus Marinimicrobia bacterium]|nr:helix-turn-helix domain-containing protein [Candidatus Neomarinimicrobiota bacterium]
MSRPTVCKWVRRFDLERLSGLQDRSRRAHHSPNALDEKIRRQTVRLRKKMPHCGAGQRDHRVRVVGCGKVGKQDGAGG